MTSESKWLWWLLVVRNVTNTIIESIWKNCLYVTDKKDILKRNKQKMKKKKTEA